jgi:hypothetical protein
MSAARRNAPPRGLRAGRHEADSDGSEQGRFQATRRQLDADVREVFDHAGPDLDQALSDGRELATGERAGLRNRRARTPHHQNGYLI